MHIVLHTGAHFTEEERLMKCLLRNKEDFSRRGVAVPGPGRYRRLLRETFGALKETEPTEDAREVLLDAILDQENAERVILSNAHFFGAPRSSVNNGQLYPKAIERLQSLVTLFPDDRIEMFMAMRNPATFLPAAFDRSPKEYIAGFLGGVLPEEILWSDFFMMVREEFPQIQITTWCNEDAPLLWAQIIREMAGLEPGQKIIGGFDLLSSIMSREGMQRFRAYLKSHPTMNEMQKRRVMAAFLDKFAIDEAIEEELDLPGWTEELVERMTTVYDDDMLEVQRIPGVTLIMP
ncbi:hypothetical protein E4Z66_00460 [Aliishimia ponticola]|uniref:Uncharacterized protein n=1 Tax=Aliishimia ponticola TaxID=2499833 RepID=A0A4S4NGY4_9RHOB|nr:hypothetical protein [Aliishimia ponticola]THH38085.1 hypothetical protein E4Z66_00460 [Aliishimia ponticola]